MTVSHIEFSSVSWANQAITFELSITKRSTVVGAKVFDAIDVVTIAHEDYESIVDLEGLRLPFEEIVELANRMKIVVADDRAPFSSRVIRIAEPVERSLRRALRGPTR
jgi:hypothetical protein